MKTDPIHALRLLDKILANNIEVLTQEEANFLLEHKEICSRKLLPILALEITQIKEKELWSPSKLYGSLKLLAAFKEKKAFDWVIQLHEFPEDLESEEVFFIPLFWANILTSTISSDWHKLKLSIEDPHINNAIREACIDTLISLVAQGNLDRTVVVEYFHHLYSETLEETFYDPELLPLLIEGSISLWPGESIEEIREIFGLDLVDDEFLSLSDVLFAFNQGKEECLSHLKDWAPTSSLFDFFTNEEDENMVDFALKDLHNLDFQESKSIDDDDDDDDDDYYEDLDHYEEKFILPPLSSPGIERLSAKEQKKYGSLPKFILEDPEKAIEIASDLIFKHPTIPSFFYYLHAAFWILSGKFQAMTILRTWIDRFPNDLLAKIEYAHYLLRREEPEKVQTLFSNTWSLVALYPERTSFHQVECSKFLHLLGSYFLQIEDIEKAKEQLQLLDSTSPNSFEYFHLQHLIDLRLQEDLFNEDDF